MENSIHSRRVAPRKLIFVPDNIFDIIRFFVFYSVDKKYLVYLGIGISIIPIPKYKGLICYKKFSKTRYAFLEKEFFFIF